MNPVTSMLDFIVHAVLRIGRERLAASAHLLADPPAPVEALPWAAQPAEGSASLSMSSSRQPAVSAGSRQDSQGMGASQASTDAEGAEGHEADHSP